MREFKRIYLGLPTTLEVRWRQHLTCRFSWNGPSCNLLLFRDGLRIAVITRIAFLHCNVMLFFFFEIILCFSLMF